VNPVNVGSIGEYIRQQREQAKISLRQLASAAGVSNPYLSQIERGLRRPSAEILQQIAKGLRISAEALYVQAGILEDRRPDSGVRAAVLTDPELTERQKQVLLEIYESFRREPAGTVTDGAVLAAVETASPQPGGTEPEGTEPGGTEPGGTEPGGTEPEGTKLAGPAQALTALDGEGTQTGPALANPAQAGPPGPGPAGPGPAGPGPVQTGARG
jgi:transcriptional regulator with XRE-family HTH domain